MRSRNTLIAGVLVICLLLASVGLILLDIGTVSDAPSSNSASAQQSQHIRINEICAKNETILADNNGRYPDYIELYNPGQPMNLQGYTLTDGVAVSQPLGNFPMDTGEYRVLFLGDDHAGFGIGAAGGDYIQLRDPDGAIVAQVSILASSKDQVMLLSGSSYVLSFDASPGLPNDAAGAFRSGIRSDSMPVVISEVLTANESALPDENGIFSDVVELHNRSEEELRLAGWYLSDSSTHRYSYQLPEITLPAGGYLLLYCDGENYIGPNGEIHTNFGLSQGEELCLTDNSGSYHCLTTQYPGENRSLSLQEDGTYQTASVSLGYANDAQGIELFALSREYTDSPLLISEVLLSSAGVPYNGTLCDVIEILNRSDAAVSTKGWYLTDDADPYRFPLPETELAAGECLVILCGKAQTDFSISDGETLRLTAPDFRHAPEVTCTEAGFGESISLQFLGDEVVYALAPVTLGFENLPENNQRFLAAMQPQGLIISEVMSANNSYLKGAYAATCDWIELYNSSDAEITLSDYTITDSRGNLQKYTLPNETLAPGGYICILLSEDGKNLRAGYSHLPFTLSSSGEEVYLSKDGKIADFLFLPEMEPDTSYGRAPGSLTFSLMAKVTPGTANSEAAAISQPVTAITAPGAYNGVEYLDITLSAPGTIYYTTDCYAPSRYSKLYTGPIRITKTTVLRVICYEEGKQASQVTDLTYLLNENDTLSVVSVVTSPGNLWSNSTGIYVDGPGWTETYPHQGANYWKNWERPATISLVDNDGEGFVSVPCGLKIFGGYSRANLKKSLACMFRAAYGAAELDYPLFGEAGLDTYEALVLRAGGQDAFDGRIRDEVITSFVNQELGISVQKYKPVVVYLNGEYFGIHFIREKINENYVAGNFHVDKEDVTLAHWNGSDSKEYQQLLRYVADHDLSVQEHFDYVASQIDVENYTDYMIAQMWIANTDTGNVKYFTTSEHPWTWVMFDTDLAFRNAGLDSISRFLNSGLLFGSDISCKTLLVCMLKNPEYKDYFIRRVAWQVNNVWVEEKVIAQIDKVEAQIDADAEKDCQRWGTSYTGWQRAVERIREFVRARNSYFLDYVQDHFRLSDAQMTEYGFRLEN